MGQDAELIDYGATKGRWAANKKHEVESPIAGARAVVLKDLYIRGGLMGEPPSYAHMLSTDSYRPIADSEPKLCSQCRPHRRQASSHSNITSLQA